MASYDNKVLTGDQLVYFSSLVKSALANKADTSIVSGKQDALEFNTAYNASSNKVATMADVDDAIDTMTYDGGKPLQSDAVAVGIEESTGDTIYLSDKLVQIDAGIASIPAPIVIEASVSGQPTVDNDGNYRLPLVITFNNMAEAYARYQTHPSTVGITVDLSAMGMSTKIYMDCESFYRNEVDGGGYTYLTYGEFNDSSMTRFGFKFQNINVCLSTDENGSYGTVIGMTTKSYVDNAITTALGGISSFSFEIVQSLPTANISTSKIYLVAKQTSGTNQVYTEYAYVNNAWEIIGDTSMSIDTLSNAEVATIWNTATASAS